MSYVIKPKLLYNLFILLTHETDNAIPLDETYKADKESYDFNVDTIEEDNNNTPLFLEVDQTFNNWDEGF